MFDEVSFIVITDSNIQFTMDIWKPGEESRIIEPKKITVVGNFSFSYLDDVMSFKESKALSFNTCSKPGFNTKYLNFGSHNPEYCMNAVLKGVVIRLAGLTTRTAANNTTCLSDIYLNTDMALQRGF